MAPLRRKHLVPFGGHEPTFIGRLEGERLTHSGLSVPGTDYRISARPEPLWLVWLYLLHHTQSPLKAGNLSLCNAAIGRDSGCCSS